MTDPRRLIEEGATEFETVLLRAGRRDAISEDGRHRVLSSLGFGAGVLVGTIASGATAVGKTGRLAVAGGALIKYIGIGGVAALAVWAGVTAWDRWEGAREHGRGIAQSVSSPTQSNVPSVPAAAAEIETNEPAIAPVSPSKTSVVAPPARRARSADVPSEQSKDSLPKELSLLDRARRELASGNPAVALRLLDEYEGLFPSGRLGAEAKILRIESLARAGDRAGVAAAGKNFLAQHPNGPYATRVRSLMGETRPAAPGSSGGRR